MSNTTHTTNAADAMQSATGPLTLRHMSGRIHDSRGRDVAQVFIDSHPDGEAFARLFVAAPDMLAALRGLFEQCAMTHKY